MSELRTTEAVAAVAAIHALDNLVATMEERGDTFRDRLTAVNEQLAVSASLRDQIIAALEPLAALGTAWASVDHRDSECAPEVEVVILEPRLTAAHVHAARAALARLKGEA